MYIKTHLAFIFILCFEENKTHFRFSDRRIPSIYLDKGNMLYFYCMHLPAHICVCTLGNRMWHAIPLFYF